MLLYFAKENTSNSYHTSTNRRNITFFQPELYSLHVLFSSLLIILGKLEGFFLILWLSIGKVKLLRISKKKIVILIEPLASHTTFVATG
jgi:hypothetical protein